MGRFTFRRRAWMVVAMAACAAGCGSTRYIYTVRPMPPVVQPPTADWNMGVGVEFSDVIHVRLANDSAEPTLVLWDECAYIDTSNHSHRVLTSAAKPHGPHVPQMPTTIAPGTTIRETLTPVRHALDGGLDPLVPSRRRGEPVVIRPGYIGAVPFHPHEQDDMLGQELGLFLVFERQGERKTVLTRYQIAHVAQEG